MEMEKKKSTHRDIATRREIFILYERLHGFVHRGVVGLGPVLRIFFKILVI